MAGKDRTFRATALTVACTDAQRSEAFYRDMLGATIVPTDNGIGRRFRFGELEIVLMPNAVKASPAEFPTHAMPILRLEVDDVAATTEWFAEQDVPIVDPGDDQFVMIADPDGLVIEVWQAE